MAFVDGCTHDLFVSYAHLDNLAVERGTTGWVDALVHNLQTELWQRLGTREFRIWKDHELAANRPLTHEIVEAVRSSALLLVVMSPGYLHSEWCRRERDEFLSVVKGRVAEGRVFIVHAREVERSAIPPEFGQLLGYEFWAKGLPSGPDQPLTLVPPEPDARTRIVELSYAIKEQVRGLHQASTSRPAAATPSVFVARSTEDLEDRELELQAYLNQAGFRVLPQHWYSTTDEAAFKRAFDEDIGQCTMFAQLLSAARGRPLPFTGAPRGPLLQAQLARSHGLPVLQWRDRSVDLAAISDPQHAALLEGARVCGMEEFKRAVAEQARAAPPPGRKSRASQASPMVFVNADAADRKLAEQVSRALAQDFGVDCYWPIEQGTPEEIRADLEDHIEDCDGLMLIYGSTGVTWVRRQLKEGLKILSQRERSLPALAVFEGPPPETKGELSAKIANLLMLNCRHGIDRSVLGQFVDNLRR